MGRVAKLGELYDARSDRFLRLSLMKAVVNESAITSTQNRETKLKYTLLNTFEEKFQNLDVSAEMKLSILGGLIELKGSGRFFKDTKRSAKSAKASLVQTFSTAFDQISISSTSVKQSIDLDVLAQIDATHVVVGIQWGGHVFVSVEDVNADNQDQQKIQGSLGAKMRLIAGTFSGNAKVDLNEKEKNELSNSILNYMVIWFRITSHKL